MQVSAISQDHLFFLYSPDITVLKPKSFRFREMKPRTICCIWPFPFKTFNFYLSKKAQELFEVSVQSRILSADELYAGKICAALDRQHPRDLFDVHLLVKNEGLISRLNRKLIGY